MTARRGPYSARPIPMDELTPKRLASYRSRIVVTNGCHIWTGGTTGHRTHPYGMFRLGRHMYPVHRIAYALEHGSDTLDNQVIDHTCGVTLCVNPAHMEPVSQRENVARGSSPIADSIGGAA